MIPVFIHVPKTGGSSIRKSIKTHYLGHLTMESSKVVDACMAKNAFVFSFLRDPLDRAVSLYYFFRDYARGEDINEFLKRLPDNTHPKWFLPQNRWFSDGLISKVNFYNFDDLESEFTRLCMDAGIDRPALKHIHKTEHGHWSEELDSVTIDILTNYYKDDYCFIKTRGFRNNK